MYLKAVPLEMKFFKTLPSYKNVWWIEKICLGDNWKVLLLALSVTGM